VKFDAIVIGAGAAGLAAARALSGRGKRVCLLEGRDRIGGRVHSLHISGLPLPIELGAEFIHGEAATSFSIVGAAGLLACELPDNHWWSRGGRWTLVRDFWGEIDRVRRRIGALRRDVSFDEFLRTRRNLAPRLRERARMFVEGYHAAHADRISALVLRTSDEEQNDPNGNRQFRLAGGYDALLHWLRAGLDPERCELRLGTAVTEIGWSSRGVTARCRRGTLEESVRARTAVITIPVGVWKAPSEQPGAIRFDPPLEEKERALSRIEAGHVVKITFLFRERWWDDPAFLDARTPAKQRDSAGPLNFLHTTDGSMPTWWTTAPLRSPLLTGWAGGHAADALLAEPADARAGRALDSMARAFGVPRRMLEKQLAGSFTHDWQADPFSRGAYSYAAVGGSEASRLLARPIGGTLFFAGEATSRDETGTVAGAIESGIRAANECITTLR
jgi:monoamine oxidase